MIIIFILWVLGALWVFSLILFRISCLFKKTCSKKNCFFRNKTTLHNPYFSGGLLDADCDKCPYPFDKEEEAELRQTMERIKKLIEQL